MSNNSTILGPMLKFKIFFVFLAICLSGCSAGNAKIISEKTEFVSYAFLDEDFSVLVDLSQQTWTLAYPGIFDDLPRTFDLCGLNEDRVCIYDWIFGDFSIPKENVSTGDTWVFRDIKFVVLDRYRSSNCSDNYVIRTSRKGRAERGYVFNYQDGIVAAFLYYDHFRGNDPEDVINHPRNTYFDFALATPKGALHNPEYCE